MTAIAGQVFAETDRPAAGDLFAGRLAERRGSMQQWAGGNACLVQSGGDAWPRAAGTPLHVTADIRLDNRDELCTALGLADAAATSDAALLIEAYARWDLDCVTRLVGDFAVAIWDERRQRLFAVRDPMGVRPLYLRQDRGGLAFASRPSLIGDPADALDDGRLAAYLLGMDDDAGDTVFAPMRRLPPGHWLTYEGGQLTIQRYAALAPDDLPAETDFAAGLRDRLVRAVDDRLRGGTVGAMLSGGLDSSSIVSAAAFSRRNDPDFRLSTYSFRYRAAPALDESRFAKAVVDKYSLDGHDVPMDDLAPLATPFDLIDGRDELVYAPGLPKIARLLSAAAQAGSSIVLDGHGGDEVASHGYGRLNELARAGRWLTLYRELRGIGYMFGDRPGAMFRQYYMARGLGRRLRNAYGRMRPRPAVAAPDPLALLDRDFVAASGIAERYAAWGEQYQRAAATEKGLHLWNVGGPAAIRALEALARAGDRMGVEVRFPFFDQRLVTFTLAVPEDQKLRDGWTRSVLRRAMQGILPEAVQWRRDKIDFGGELARGLVRHHRDVLEAAAAPAGPLAGIVDLGFFRQRLDAFVANPEAAGALDLFAIWRAVALSRWLEDRRARRTAARDAA